MSGALKKAIRLLYIVLLGATLLILLFADRKVRYVVRNGAMLFPNLLIAAVAVGLWLVGRVWSKRHDTIGLRTRPAGGARRFYGEIAALAVALFLVQVFISRNILFLTGWDVKAVRESVEDICSTGRIVRNTWEYAVYPNNFFITCILAVVFWGAELLHIDPNFAYVIVECFLVDLAVLLVGLILYALTEKRSVAFAGFGVSALLFGLSPWITIPYTDGYGVLFPVASLYFYIQGKRWKLPLLIRQLLVVLPATIGYMIKPQGAIVAIAIVIVSFLDLLAEAVSGKIRRCASVVAVSACSAAIAGLLIAAVPVLGGYSENEASAMVPMHYVMMGLNEETDGGFCDADVQMTCAVKGKANKTSFCAGMALDRVREFGFSGLAAHLTRKTLGNYNDGTFAWGLGDFYYEVPDAPFGVISEALRGFFYNNGENYKWFANGEQFLWIAVLLAGYGGAFISAKRYQSEELVIYLSLVGITLFTLLFESRARYLYVYAPFYVLAAAIGLEKINGYMKDRKHT